MPGAWCARSLACKIKARKQVTTVTPETSGIPRAMVLTVSFALSLVTGLFVTIPGVKRELHRRVNASIGASGPHDFAVRQRRRSSFGAFASTASRPTFVTMANAPRSGGTREALEVICPTG
jgi:hypothetical protein